MKVYQVDAKLIFHVLIRGSLREHLSALETLGS